MLPPDSMKIIEEFMLSVRMIERTPEKQLSNNVSRSETPALLLAIYLSVFAAHIEILRFMSFLVSCPRQSHLFIFLKQIEFA